MRIVEPQEAVAGIGSGDRVYVHGAAGTPSILLDALVARAPELQDVNVVHLHIEGPGPHLAPEMADHFRHRALFVGPNARRAVSDGRADYVPMFLSDVPRLFDSGALPLDAVLVNATPPDPHGFCSLGVSVEAMHAAIRAARTVIVQFNRAMPRTLGESFIHVSDIDLAVERGELQCRAFTITAYFAREPFISWRKRNFVNILFQTGSKRDARLKDTPTIYELMDSYKTNEAGRRLAKVILAGGDFGRPLVAPPGVPADRIKILRDSFDKTINDPALMAEAEKRRLEIDPTRWDEMESLAKEVMATPPDVVARMRKLLGE